MKTSQEILKHAVCVKCGQPILDSGFKYSAYYFCYSLYWHIYCRIRNDYNATGNPNAEFHTTNEIIKLYV